LQFRKKPIPLPSYLQFDLMKQLFAIALLIVTLLASSRPAVSFHYCGGKLRSISFASSEKKSCCAASAHPEDPTQTALRKAPCCSNRLQIIAIDHFVPSHSPEIPSGNDRNFQPAILPNPLTITANAFSSHPFQSLFPPGKHPLPAPNLLILLCTLLI
jgi:hypothetical protein